MDLDGFDRSNTKKFEAYLREHKDTSNFSVTLICNWYYLSNDFIREFKDEFVEISKHYFDGKEKWRFKYKREPKFFSELFGEE